MFEKIPYGDHPLQFMHYYPGDPNLPLISLWHGGFFRGVDSPYDLTLMTLLAEDLARDGYPVANMEYVRVGEGWTAIEMTRGIFQGHDSLRPYVTAAGCIADGHSVGGWITLHLAGREKYIGTELELPDPLIPKFVIASGPLTDLYRGQQEGLSTGKQAIKIFITSATSLTGEEEELYYYLTPGKPKVPVHLIQGARDKDVPSRYAEAYAKMYCKEDVYLHLLGKTNHLHVIDKDHMSWKLQKALIRTF